ncbi:titin-like isoform X2 [Larimichthys crocea]|uniref:titin-like isoform X2 n=1 Tax=Larimichthys crocea TaxID=215358 RepID=UPI000F5F4EE9|nr:titin-like isoform X2 [Larimichthys crocea]
MVMEREKVEEKPKMYRKDEEETVGEPDEVSEISSDISVTDGLKTEGLKTKVTAKTEEKVMTRSESKRKKVVSFKREPSKQKSQDKEFSVQITDSPETNEEIKDAKQDTKEHKERKAGSPEISVRTVSDQKQVIEPKQVTEGFSTPAQISRDKPKISERKPELKDSRPLEKASLQKKLKQTDQEQKPLNTENIETTPKKQETDSSELVKSIEKVESLKAEEKLCAGPKTPKLDIDVELDNFESRADTIKDMKQGQRRKERKDSVKPVTLLNKESSPEKLPSSELLPESILSEVVTLKGKLVKVSPMEGTTEMKPDREIVVTPSVEVKCPESLSERETITDSTLQKPETLSKARTLKDVAQKVRQQTVVEDEDLFKTTIVKDKHVKIHPKEKAKPRQEQTEKSGQDGVPKQIPEQYYTESEDSGNNVTSMEGKYYKVTLTEETKPELRQTQRKSPVTEVEEIKQIEEILIPECTSKRLDEDKTDTTEQQKKPTRKKQVGRKPSEIDKIDSESVAPQEPQQKSQVVIVEQDQQRVSTVKDKTFKVTPLKELKSEQEQIERKGSVTSMMEETSKKLEEVPQKLEFVAVDEEMNTPEGMPSQESISLQKKEQKSSKTKKAADKQIPLSVKVKDKTKKVTPIQDGAPEKHAKTEEIVTEPATFDDETDTIDSESISPPQPQQKLTKPQEIIVEQGKLRVSTVKDKTFKVTALKETKSKQEDIERKVSVMEETSEELEEAQEKLEFEAVDDEIHVSEGIPPKELISLQKKEQKTTKTEEAADKQIPPPVTVKDKTKKVTPIQDGALKKHAKTEEFVTEPATFDDETDTIDSESVSPQQPQQKLTKPQEIIVEQDKLRVSTVKDKTFKVTPLKESKSKQEHIERKVSVMEETSEELEEAQEKLEIEAVDEIHVSESIPPKELISLQKKEKTKTKETADKQISPSVKVKDKTKKVTPIKDGTPDKDGKTKEFVTEPATFDEETDTTEIESVSPQQKLTKPQEIIVEQDKLRLSTVKDKTFKVTPLKESKSKQEHIERKVSVTPMIEETSEELEEAQEKLEFEAVDDEIHVSEGIPPKELISLQKKEQKTTKTEEAADKQIPPPVTVKDKTKKVTPIQDGALKKHAKTEEFVTEPATFDDETDTIDSESVSPQQPQQKLTKPQEIIVEQDKLGVSTVKDKTFKVTPLKESKSKQEHIERKVSVTPMIEETFEELEEAQEKLQFEAVDEINMPEGMPSQELISLQKKEQKTTQTKEAADKQIPPPVTVKDKTKKVTPIKDATPEKHAKTKKFVTEPATFDDETDTIDSESVSPPELQQKLTKPQEIIVEQGKLRLSTVKDKTFKVTPLKESKSKQEHIERKVSVTPMMEETFEELEEAQEKLEIEAVDDEIHVSESIPPKELISLQKKEKTKTKEAADKQISPSVKVKDKTKKVTPIQDGTPEKHAKTKEIVTEPATFDDETDTIDSESVSPQRPQQKLTKPQEIIVEQGKLRLSTVKDKTFKVTALKETKSKQEDIERKVSVTPMMEETSEELEEAQEKLQFEAVDDEIHVSEGIPPKELISLQKKEQKTTKTEEAADKQIPPPVTVKDKTKKVTPIQDGALKKHAKTKEFVTEPATFDDETDTIDSESVSPQQKLTKPQEIIVEQDKLRVSTVKDKTFKVTPLKESKSKQEDIERKISVTPMIEETSEEEELKVAPEKLKFVAAEETSNQMEKLISPQEQHKLNKSQLKQKSELTKRGIEKGQFETIHSEKKEEKSENIADKIQSKGDRKNVKPAKFAPLEERQTMQEQTETKAAIIPEIDLKQKKAEEDIQSETVTVKDEYGQFTLFEETKQVKRVTAAPVMEVATEKSQVVEDGGVISDTLKHITVEQAKTKENIIKDIPEKIEVERKVSGAPKPEVSHEDTSEKLEIMYKTTTVPPVEEMKTELTKTVVSPTTKVTKRDIQREKDVLKMIDESEHISQIKEATQTEVEQKIEKTSELLTEDIKTKKSKSIKDKKTLPKSTKTTLEEVQSRTVVVKDIFGTVTPFEVTETKPEQIETKFSMAPVMEVASQRSLIVKDGDVKSDTLQMYVTPDELVRDIASRKEDIYESDEISVKTKDTKDTGVEQVQSKVDRVQDKTEKMTPIEEKLPEKQEQIERKASVASKPEVTDQHSLVDTEEFKTKQRQTETKTFVTPVKEVTDTEIKEIQSKKSKSLKDKGQRVDKGTKTSLEEVQSKTIMFKDEYGTVTPFGVTETKQEEVKRTVSIAPVMEIASEKHFIVKDGDVKSDTLQRFIVPDKLVKDITSKKEDIRESRDDSLRLSQGSETAKESAGMSQVRSEFKTDDAIQTKQKQTNQEAERTAVAHQKALVGEHAKTEIALKDHSLRHEEIKYDNTSPKKLDFKYQEQATAESIQSRTDTVKDVFLSVTPEIETKQEQIDRKASRTPVMDVAYETPLTVKQQDNILDTSRRYMSPDDLVKDTTSRKKVAYESDDISLKTDKFTTDTTPKEMLIEQDALERQLGLTKPKKIKTETTIVKDKIIKEFHDKEKTDIKTTVEEQIKGKDLGIPTKRSGEIEIINEEIKSYKPTIKESKADIEWQEPTAREPSVTDKTKRKIIEKKTTMDYKTASPEYREGATRKPEVEPFLKVDVQYVPPHEVETISRKKGEAQELETRVLSVEPDGKQLVSPQESFRGIEGKMLHVTEHRVFLI